MEIKSSHLENDSFKVYLEDLCSALEEVSPEYKKWILYNTDASGEVKETQESYCERVFASELYHRFPKKGHFLPKCNSKPRKYIRNRKAAVNRQTHNAFLFSQ